MAPSIRAVSHSAESSLPICLRSSPIRQPGDRDGSTTELAPQLQPAIVQLKEAPGDGQPEAGALVASGGGRRYLAEWLQCQMKVLFSDANAGIADFDTDIAALETDDMDVDLTAFRCEFDGIPQQIQDDLANPTFIAMDPCRDLGVPYTDVDAFLASIHIDEGRRVIDNVLEIRLGLNKG